MGGGYPDGVSPNDPQAPWNTPDRFTGERRVRAELYALRHDCRILITMIMDVDLEGIGIDDNISLFDKVRETAYEIIREICREVTVIELDDVELC